jgi:hypothetical protein
LRARSFTSATPRGWQHRHKTELTKALAEDLLDDDAQPIYADCAADEGDLVKGGQTVARMDTQDLAASLKKAQAQVKQNKAIRTMAKKLIIASARLGKRFAHCLSGSAAT